MLALFVERAKADPLGAIGVVGLAVSLLCFVIEFRYLVSVGNEPGVLVRNMAYGVWTIGLLMLATLALRTLRIRHVVRYWLFGFFPAIAAVLIVEAVIPVDDGNLRTALIVPILEELLKAVPLVVLMLLARAKRIAEPAITDFAVVGFAIGAGFGLHEDGLWERDIAGGFDSSFWGRLFPNFLDDNPFVVAHPGWTALIGLGLGFMWHFRHRRAAWLIGLAPFLVAVADHMSINYRGDNYDRFRGWVMEGRLPARMLVVGLIAAVAVDWYTRRSADMSDRPSMSLRARIAKARSMPTRKTQVLGAIILIAQLRWLNGVAYRQVRERRPQTASPSSRTAASQTTTITTF